MSDGIGLVSMPHPEGSVELAAEIILLRAENESLRKSDAAAASGTVGDLRAAAAALRESGDE